METVPTSPIEIKTSPISPDILEEIESFEEEVQRLKAGEIIVDVFKPFRLQHGIYGQRQPGVQMVRIKIPFGGLTANQLRCIAEIAETYTTGIGHVTTRQDIQLHFAALDDVGAIMRRLAEVGLTTREACGNTVRNVTACHLAGVCRGEVFDVTPYAKTVAYYLLRNPLNQSLPRKFKIAFSGCRTDCALTPIHDLGFLAAKAEDGMVGFRMTAGGGLGPAPRVGQVLREFVPFPDLIPSIEAVLKVFDTLGNRKNRHKARMKFIIDKLGFPEFKRRWEEAYAALGGNIKDHPTTLLDHQDAPPLVMPTGNRQGRPVVPGLDDRNQADIPALGNGAGSEPDESSAYQTWHRFNVLPQKQEGYASVLIKLPIGDVTSAQMLHVANLADRYANGNIRTTVNQNLIIRWIPESDLPPLYQELRAADLAAPGANQIEDIVACPGTDTCGLGITSSKGMARALAELFPSGQVEDDLKGVSLKISGCHNSCAQHHIATIGLHGVGKRIGDHVAPFYELHLGGQVNGTAQIGNMTVKIPAKNVPAALSHFITAYRRDRNEGESLQAFIGRMGKAALKQELIPYTFIPSFDDDASYYYDWEADDEFTTEDLGPGECAGGALEMIENRMLEADQELYQARLLAEKHQYGFAVNKTYRAAVAAAKAILVTEGVDPATDADTLSEFEQRIIQKGLLTTWHDDVASLGDLGSKAPNAEFTQSKLAQVNKFVEACKALSEQLSQELATTGSNQTESPAPQSGSPDGAGPADQAPVLDLRGVMCPLNYVKTKLKLEMMEKGARLEVWLDAGDPIKNVPVSLRNDGHRVLAEDPLEPEAAHFKVLVEKEG